jgi:hypothetical protein
MGGVWTPQNPQTSIGTPLVMCSLTGDSERNQWMSKPLALETEHLSPQGSCWETWRGDCLPATVREERRAQERESLSLWELCGGNLEEWLLYWGPWRMCKGRLWKRAPISAGDPLVNLEGGGVVVHLPGTPRDSDRALCKSSVSACGSSVRGTWRKGSFTGNTESYIGLVKEGYGSGASLSL